MVGKLEGGCVCGGVRFVASGEPWRVGLCHCLTCRKRHAAAFNAFAVFPREAVTFTDAGGEPIALDRLGVFASSRQGRRYFCRACGSPVLSADEAGDEVEVFLGSLDHPNRLAPTYEAFTPRRETWLGAMQGLLRRYEGNRTGGRRGQSRAG